MHLLFKIIFLLVFSLKIEVSPTLPEIRTLYQQCEKSEQACKDLIKLLEPYNENNSPLYMGYKASATMMMARHVFNPFSKLSYFKKGKKMLESAIKADVNDVELRALRFAAQSNIPSFLGYNESWHNDKLFILKSYKKVTDTVLKETIYYFMTKWGKLTEEEKEYLK